MPTGGQYRIAGIAMRLGHELGIPMLGPAIYQQLYLPSNNVTNRAKAKQLAESETPTALLKAVIGTR
jgi:hypothetical protein